MGMYNVQFMIYIVYRFPQNVQFYSIFIYRLYKMYIGVTLKRSVFQQKNILLDFFDEFKDLWKMKATYFFVKK